MRAKPSAVVEGFIATRECINIRVISDRSCYYDQTGIPRAGVRAAVRKDV